MKNSAWVPLCDRGEHGGSPLPRTAVVCVAYLVLALIMTHPLWLHLDDAVPSDIGDPLLNAWTLAWDTHALLSNSLRLFDANIFYPLPNTLAYSEHLLATAWLALPMQAVTGEPLVAYNSSLLLSFVLGGLGMYLLCQRWTGRQGPAFLAGLAFAFAPYRLAAISHLQLLTLQWLPFSLLALDWLLEGRRSRRAAVLFVLFTTLQVLSSWYLAIFSALVLAVYTLAWLIAKVAQKNKFPRWSAGFSLPPGKRQPEGCTPAGSYFSTTPSRHRTDVGLLRRVVCLLVCVTIIAGLTLPAAYPYVGVLSELKAARPAEMAASLAAQTTDFLAAAPFLRIVGPLTRPLRERPGFTEENTLFPGATIPLLALIGIVVAGAGVRSAARGMSPGTRWRAVALLAVVAISITLTLSEPYLALIRIAPALRVVRAPARWIIPATFGLAALAGYGLAGLRDRLGKWEISNGKYQMGNITRLCPFGKRVWYLGCCLIGLALLAEAFAVPLPLATVGSMNDLPPVYRALRQLAIVEPMPDWAVAEPSPYSLLPTSYSHFAASPTPDWAVVELPMHVAPAPEYPETRRMLASRLGWWRLVNGYSGFTPARQPALGQQLADFPSPGAMEALRELGSLGVRYLVVHPGESPYDRARWQAQDRYLAERNTTLRPVGTFGPDELYFINPCGDELITHPADSCTGYGSPYAPVATGYYFADQGARLRLLAYLLEPALGEEVFASRPQLAPATVRLTLYWQTSARLAADYTVFVHSLDDDGQLIGQADGLPVANGYPTTTWKPGEIVQDSRLVPVGHSYLVGLYDASTGERLPVFAADGGRLADDAVRVAGTSDE